MPRNRPLSASQNRTGWCLLALIYPLLLTAGEADLEEHFRRACADEACQPLWDYRRRLEAGEPADLQQRARRWLELAEEIHRRTARPNQRELRDESIEARLSACRILAEAKAWKEARDLAAQIRGLCSKDDATPMLACAIDLELEACQALQDRSGEARLRLILWDSHREMPQLGESRRARRKREQGEQERLEEIRGLLTADDPLWPEVDRRQLEGVMAWDAQAISQHWPMVASILARPASAADARIRELIDRFLAAALKVAGRSGDRASLPEDLREWIRTRQRQREQDLAQQAETPDPVAKAHALRQLSQLRHESAGLDARAPTLGPSAALQQAADLLAEPRTDAMAQALLMVSAQALKEHPEGTTWFAWAQKAYAARPGIMGWETPIDRPRPEESTALDWECRGHGLLTEHPEAALRCLHEAAAHWTILARQRDDWRLHLRAEDCLRAAGETPVDPLPKPDPDASVCLGPDALTLARACQDLAAARTKADQQAGQRRLLDLLGLTLGEQLYSQDGPSRTPRYHGRIRGMLRAQRAWHLGDQALDDLATAFRHSHQPLLVELIGALGGTRAAATLGRLEAELVAMPEAWAGWLDAVQQAVPDQLPAWLDQVLPKLDDASMQSLIRHAGPFVQGQARERLANAMLQRGDGEQLQQVLIWWMSDADRLRRTDLLSFWHRFPHWRELHADLLHGLTASRDPRAGWWLLAVATMQDHEPLRVTALRGLALLAVPEARALCQSILGESAPLRLRIAAAQTAAALGDGDHWRQPARAWLNELEDDTEDDRVRDLRCLLLALEANADDLAWVHRAALEPMAWMRGELVRSLAATRLRSAVAPAVQLANDWLTEADRRNRPRPEHDHRVKVGILLPAFSRLPLDDAQRQEWAKRLGQPIPPPTLDPIPVRGPWSSETSD